MHGLVLSLLGLFWCRAPGLSSVLIGVVQLIYVRIGVVSFGAVFWCRAPGLSSVLIGVACVSRAGLVSFCCGLTGAFCFCFVFVIGVVCCSVV